MRFSVRWSPAQVSSGSGGTVWGASQQGRTRRPPIFPNATLLLFIYKKKTSTILACYVPSPKVPTAYFFFFFFFFAPPPSKADSDGTAAISLALSLSLSVRLIAFAFLLFLFLFLLLLASHSTIWLFCQQHPVHIILQSAIQIYVPSSVVSRKLYRRNKMPL